MTDDERNVSAGDLATGLAAADSDEARSLAAYLSLNPDLVASVGRVPLSDLRRTYATRLRRFERAEGPACYGLARFVQTLSGDGSADLFVVNSGETAWVGLLAADGSVLDVTAVDQQ